MSIICLICKDKLLNSAPGSSVGSLNSLVENQVISTGCGHLYHSECLQCWFRTQKKKMLNQGITGSVTDHCPTCQNEVIEDQIRRVYLLEDHRDSLEKAKLLEKMENLEIYCHQLEVHVNQLQRENDLLLNKALAPPSSHVEKDNFAAIIKNDRVMWMKKDNPPLSGIVLSIFKKEKALWVKLKLDKKIRANQRSGLFGSFRFDKKHEVTVPFEEIVLEKDYQKNNIIEENTVSFASSTNSASPALRFLPHRTPSFRNSTLSLPGEYLSETNFLNGRTQQNGLHPVGSYDLINNFGSMNSVQFPYNGQNFGSVGTMEDRIPEESHNHFQDESSLQTHQASDQNQRDYVIILRQNSNMSQKSSSSCALNEERENRSLPPSPSPTSQEKKHVTFADDLLHKSFQKGHDIVGKGNHFRDHDYKNVSEMPMSIQDKFNFMTGDGDTHAKFLKVSKVDSEEIEENVDEQVDGTMHQGEPLTPSTITSTPTPTILPEFQRDMFTESYESAKASQDQTFNQSCFDITFSTLFYKCDAFDKALFKRNASNDLIQTVVQQILKNDFVDPLRESEQCRAGYSTRLHESISHLCSSYLDLEELMSILFEYVFKLPPFISYSYDMCDYIHQFFIDFTDKAKKPSVQQLLERSLSLQDNLKLRGEPSPALFLQMPNSDDGIIHYDAVIPSLTLNLEQLLEKDAAKTEAQSCYCNKTATLECASCAKIHGKSPVLFCEDCSVLLEAIHNQMYHKLELVPIKALKIPSTCFELASVICLKGDCYSAFLRNVSGDLEKESKWIFIEEFNDGRPKIEKLPKLERWIEFISSNPSELELNYVNTFQRKLITECRMFLYLPAENSFA